jgi:hypothetical protein
MREFYFWLLLVLLVDAVSTADAIIQRRWDGNRCRYLSDAWLGDTGSEVNVIVWTYRMQNVCEGGGLVLTVLLFFLLRKDRESTKGFLLDAIRNYWVGKFYTIQELVLLYDWGWCDLAQEGIWVFSGRANRPWLGRRGAAQLGKPIHLFTTHA